MGCNAVRLVGDAAIQVGIGNARLLASDGWTAAKKNLDGIDAGCFVCVPLSEKSRSTGRGWSMRAAEGGT